MLINVVVTCVRCQRNAVLYRRWELPAEIWITEEEIQHGASCSTMELKSAKWAG